MKKRILAMLLVFVMLLSAMPAIALAVEPEGTGVAEVDGTGYETLQAAIDAADGKTVKLLDSIELTTGVTVAKSKSITLDLNGKTLSYQDSSGTTSALITNNGTLTITDTSESGGGKITYSSTTPDSNYGYATNAITNRGTLAVEAGTIENNTGRASYAIDNNSTDNNANLTVSGNAVITAVADAIRQYANSSTYENNVTITGGRISGFRAVYIQSPLSNSGTKTNASLSVSGESVLESTDNSYYIAVYSYSHGQSLEGVEINISGGTINGGVYVGVCGGQAATTAEKVTISGGVFSSYVYSYSTTNNVSISGGTFTAGSGSYAQYYLAEGYEVKQNEDGSYGVAEKTVEPELPKFKKTSMILEEAIDIRFWALQSELTDIDGAYAVITLTKATGVVVSSGNIPSDQWDGSDGTYYKIRFNNIAAKEMCDTITVNVYDEDGNPLTQTLEYTLGKALVALYKSSSDADMKELAVAMLNYGAAAQKAFNYNEDNLATDYLSQISG